MKKQANQALHPSQRLLIRKTVLTYYLYILILDRKPKRKIKHKAPKKVVKKHTINKPLGAVDEPHANLRSTNKITNIPPSDIRQIYQEDLESRETVSLTKHDFSRLKKISFGFGIFLILIIGVQLLYPSNRALPLSRLQSKGFIGPASSQQILQTFEDFDSRIVTIHTHTKTLTTSYKDLGVTIQPEQTIESITDYQLADRLIPFSIIFKGNKNYSIKRDLNEAQLNLYVDNVIAQASKKPKSASVILEKQKLKLIPSEEGYEYQLDVLRSQVLRSDLSDKGQIVFTPTILNPEIATESIQSMVDFMQSRIDNSFTIKAEGKTEVIDTKTMASWLYIKPKPSDNTIEIGFNPKKVETTLNELEQRVNKDQVPTVITFLNGNQVGQNIGKKGKRLEKKALVNRIVDLQLPIIDVVDASVLTIQPEKVIDRRYTKDNEGIRSLIDYWVANNPGSYSIDLKSQNGQISFSKDASKLYPAVGIYRAYIASLIYARVNAGSLKLSTVTQAGLTVDSCLSLMLRDSHDPCTDALGTIIAWGASDSLLSAQGFNNTTLARGASLTTASDSTRWLSKMLSGEISTFEHGGSMTEHMINQNFDGGIAGGIKGSEVASRSGSFERINNDIAIVYNPTGTYYLSILSEGSSFEYIANLAFEIDKVMSQ